MTIDQILKDYWFHDGSIKSFHLDIPNNRVELELLIRRIKNRPPSGMLSSQDFEPCTLKLVFEDLIKVSLFDRFPTQGNYLNFSTFVNGKENGVSMNVHDNSSYTYEKDNWVISSRSVTWKEIFNDET